MKPALLLCIIGMTALTSRASVGQSPQSVQPFTAVIWTTTTLHSPSGKPSTFMRRTVYSRDASGNVRRELYQPTKGLQHDLTAPLERVLMGFSSAQTPLQSRLSQETVEQVSIGTLNFSGVPAAGTRQIFKDANGQPTHTLETWYSTTLGLTMRMESSNVRGDTVFSDLSELHLGDPVASATGPAPGTAPVIPLLILYQGLFTQIAHMERYRQADDPNRHVNMDQIEDHLRNKLGLSTTDWQILVGKSVKVESYSDEMSTQARAFVDQARATRHEQPVSANTLSASRATLHKMQLDVNAHVQGEIDQLKATVGPDAADRIEVYLKGTLAASTSVISAKTAQLQAQQGRKALAQ